MRAQGGKEKYESALGAGHTGDQVAKSRSRHKFVGLQGERVFSANHIAVYYKGSAILD